MHVLVEDCRQRFCKIELNNLFFYYHPMRLDILQERQKKRMYFKLVNLAIK